MAASRVMIFILSIIMAGSLFLAAAQNQDYLITIDGQVTRGAPYQGEAIKNTKIYFMYPDTQELIDSALTDNEGYYSKLFNYVKIQEKYSEMTPGMKVLGNPVVENIRMNLGIFENDKYTLRVFDLSGKMILSQDINLSEGDNLVSVSGLGNAGVKIISVSNGKETYTEKIIQSSTGAFSPSINVTSASYNSDRVLKSFVLDSLLIRAVPNQGNYLNFETQEKVVEAVNSTVDFELPQQMYLFSTILKPYLETGAPVTDISPGFYVNVDFDDGSEQFPVINGEINIERGIYPYEDALGSIWISNDTATYNVNGVENGVQNWTIIRQPKQKTNRPNVAQNESSNHMANVEYETLIPMDSLDQKTNYLYTIRKKAETQPGTYESLNSEFSRMLIERSGNIKSSMFIDLAPFGVADSLDVVRFGFNYSTNLPNTPEQQERLDNLLQLVLETRYLQNGDTLLPPHRVYTIADYSDPRWQELVARNYENMIRTAYYNGTPENTRIWSSTYTYNGELRLQKTFSKYNINDTDAVLFAEDFSAGTGMVEGAGQNLLVYIWNSASWAPSEYAYSISPIPALLNLGTGQNLEKSISSNRYRRLSFQ